MEKKWGYYGDEPPCEHLLALRRFLEENEMTIWSEHGTNPFGWVNIHCSKCGRTYETVLDEPWSDDDLEEEQ